MGARAEQWRAVPAALGALLALFTPLAFSCGKSHGPDGRPEASEPTPAALRGVVYVRQGRLPYVLEIDTRFAARPIALATGPIAREDVVAESAFWSADGTRLAYVVRAGDERVWLAVAQAPDWGVPIAEWSLPTRSEQLSWLGPDELLVDLGGGHIQRHALGGTAPEDLGWFRSPVSAGEIWLAHAYEGPNLHLLRPGSAPSTIALEASVSVFLAEDGARAALLSSGSPPQVESDLLQLNGIGWQAPVLPSEEACIRESPSCPIVVQQPHSYVNAVRWTPDGTKLLVQVEAMSGKLDVNRETRVIPHASGYSLSVGDVGQALQLGAEQASPARLQPPRDPAADAAQRPAQTIWAWGDSTFQRWGVLGDGRVYYLDWGDPYPGGIPGEPETAAIKILPHALASADEARVWRGHRRGATLFAVLPTRDEQALLVIDWDPESERSSLARIPLQPPGLAGDETLPIFESDHAVMTPLLPHRGPALLLREARDAPPGGDCQVGCGSARHWLVLDPAQPRMTPLPEDLQAVRWAPDDSGVLGLLDGHAVFIDVQAPERVHRLIETDELLLPPVWPEE